MVPTQVGQIGSINRVKRSPLETPLQTVLSGGCAGLVLPPPILTILEEHERFGQTRRVPSQRVPPLLGQVTLRPVPTASFKQIHIIRKVNVTHRMGKANK